MWNRIFCRRTAALQAVFTGHYVEVKALYAFQFNTLCSVSFVGELDTSDAYRFIVENCNGDIVSVYQHIFFDHSHSEFYFNNTIFVLRNKRMIELGNNYCQVLHRPLHNGWAKELVTKLAAFKSIREAPAIGFAWQVAQN